MSEPTPPEEAKVLKAIQEGKGRMTVLPEGFELEIEPIHFCTDPKKPVENCTAPHCPVCGSHYTMMVFQYPGPCTEMCRKIKNNDLLPARSSLVKRK